MAPPEVSLPSPRWAVLLGLVTLALLAGPAAVDAVAACTVSKATAYDNPGDQDSNGAVRASQSVGQSFKVPGSVVLDRVSLYLSQNGPTTDSITVEIRSDSGGLPGAVLGTRTRTLTNTAVEFVDFDFSSDHIALAAGTTYYIVATSAASDTDGYSWSNDTTSPTYTDGSGFASQNGSPWFATPSSDNLFRVWGQICLADSPPSSPTSSLDQVAPTVFGLGLLNRTFRAASNGGTIARKKPPVGTRVRYRLSEAATARFRVERAAKGRRKAGKCVAPTAENRKARRCTRYRRLMGSFSRVSKSGLSSFRFTGRLRGRKLRPGRYRLVMAATDAAGNKSKPKLVRFRVVLR